MYNAEVISNNSTKFNRIESNRIEVKRATCLPNKTVLCPVLCYAIMCCTAL